MSTKSINEAAEMVEQIGQLESDNAELRAVAAVHEETIAELRGVLDSVRENQRRAAIVDQKTADDLRKRLRFAQAGHEGQTQNTLAFQADLEAMTAERDAAAKYVDELHTKIANQAARIRELEGATNHAGGLQVQNNGL